MLCVRAIVLRVLLRDNLCQKCWVDLWGDPHNTTLRNATFNWEGGSHSFIEWRVEIDNGLVILDPKWPRLRSNIIISSPPAQANKPHTVHA